MQAIIRAAVGAIAAGYLAWIITGLLISELQRSGERKRRGAQNWGGK